MRAWRILTHPRSYQKASWSFLNNVILWREAPGCELKLISELSDTFFNEAKRRGAKEHPQAVNWFLQKELASRQNIWSDKYISRGFEVFPLRQLHEVEERKYAGMRIQIWKQKIPWC